jgi:NTE family protein
MLEGPIGQISTGAGAASGDKRPPFQIALVLQGGGALGAYQAGVYQALHEASIEPDWVIGTSIGAINAGLIAGNAPEKRLTQVREFWHRMRAREFWGLANWPGLDTVAAYWSTVFGGIPSFFEPNPASFLSAHFTSRYGPSRLLFYGTARKDARGAHRRRNDCAM